MPVAADQLGNQFDLTGIPHHLCHRDCCGVAGAGDDEKMIAGRPGDARQITIAAGL